MKIRLGQHQLQKTMLAPTMQQSIEVLMLSIHELSQTIDQTLQENPLLEIEDTNNEQQNAIDQLIRQNQHRFKHLDQAHTDDGQQGDDPWEEKPIVRSTPLEDYLLQQLRLELTDPLDLKIGEMIIGQLDSNGYFSSSIEEVARLLKTNDHKRIEDVLETIQNFEPAGIAARNLKECLLIQAHFRFNGNKEIICRVIQDHLEDLGRKRYQDIAKKMKISMEEVRSIAKSIATLEPKPSRNYQPIDGNLYIKPDIFILKDKEGAYQIQVNNDSVPQLRISAFYTKMLNDPKLTREAHEFIREKIKNGLNFIKSIEQRHQTIKAISKYFLDHQREFLDTGHAGLKPMTLKDIANEIGRNESTVSRAIHNKFIDTPQGVFPMKYFFSQGLPSQNNEHELHSNTSIKEELKTLVADENKNHPLSDQDIQNYFENKGMKIARRTISKYRLQLKILPSHLRKD